MKTQDFNKDFTKGEQEFILKFLSNNECGATKSEELLQDNFSCQSLEDIHDIMSEYNKHQASGYLSSLENKGVIYIEERRGDCDLYWINDSFLEDYSLEF